MDDDVIVIYDEIDEEPEQFTAQNYEYMLAQSLLTKEAIQEKLHDPSENANFQFVGSASLNNSIWDNFLAITYGGVEQNFFKCRDCSEIFDKDPQKSMGQLKNHKCKKVLIKREKQEFQETSPKTTIRNTPNRKSANKIADKPRLLTREQLSEMYRNPKERPFLVTKQKNNFRCFAWQWMDLVFYKKQRQPFARCRFCESLVTYSNKNGTSSIRKHALRCQAILAAKHNLGQQGIEAPNLEIKDPRSMKVEDEDSFSDDSNNCELENSLIPDVQMYEEEMPMDSPTAAATKTTTTTRAYRKSDPTKTNSTKKPNAMSVPQLRSLYNSNKTSKAFHFSKFKVAGIKNLIWNWLELVFYKDLRQPCYRCTVCDTLVSSANEEDLVLHIESHNIKFNHNPKKMAMIKKEKLPETLTENKSKANLKRHSLPVPKTEPLEELIEDEAAEIHNETESDLSNVVANNMIDCVITSSGQALSFMENPNFRLFAQSLINFGAKYGETNANDFIPSNETILKHSIPHRMRTLKAKIKELVANEPHLSVSVDLVRDGAPHSKPVSYFSVKTHTISQCFTNRSYVVGIQEFPDDQATGEAVREAFVEIMKEYLDTDQLEKRCIVVLNESNAILTEAFAAYTRLPSITHSLESITNKVLQVDDPELKISDIVRKVQELIEHITNEHNYSLGRGECLLDLLEEFYEMNKPIEKLLKYTRPCQRDHSALSDIPKNKVKTILNGFEVIKLCVDTIRQNQITINGILLWKKKLVEQYSPVLFEHQMNARLKFHTLELIQTQFPVDDPIYKIALFLNPNFKNLKILTEAERKEVFNSIKEFYFKKINTKRDAGRDDNSEEEFDKEVQKYFATKSFDSSSDDLLRFWKKTTSFPNLRTLARYILSLPSTSEGVHEELFRKAHRAIENGVGTRADFNSIIFLNSNFAET